MSLIGLYPCWNISAPTVLSITSASTSFVLPVTAIIGNLLVLLAVIIDPNRNLRSRFNFLVANLASADLIVGFFALPMSVEFYIRESKSHLPIAILRRDHARRVGYFISCTASLLSLAVLARDRFSAIEEPLRYRTQVTTKQAAIVSLVIWVISTGLPFLYFQIGFLNYSFFFANTAVIATFTVLCLTYVKVLKTFEFQVKSWDALHDGHDHENHAKMRAIKWQTKITKTFLILLTLFICCFIPALTLIYVISFCASCHCTFIHLARDINFISTMANSCMNPFVFAWRVKRYRDAFAKIVPCRRIVRKVKSVSVDLNVSVNSLEPQVFGTYRSTESAFV